jgi:hypothetical protein
MKKLMLSLTLVAGLGLVAAAQTNALKFGIKAGVNFPNLQISGEELEEEELDGLKANTSFYFGATVEIPVSKTFSVQSGLSYIGKGAKVDYNMTEGANSFSFTSKINLMYLELPVNALFKFDAGQGNVFVGGGVYYGYALSGNTKTETTLTLNGQTEKDSDTSDLIFGNTEADDFKRGDFGLNFLAGYQLANGLNFHGGYSLGLRNISSSSGGTVKNKGFSFGLGFNF